MRATSSPIYRANADDIIAASPVAPKPISLVEAFDLLGFHHREMFASEGDAAAYHLRAGRDLVRAIRQAQAWVATPAFPRSAAGFDRQFGGAA